VRVLREQVDLSCYTTLRLGGPAARFTEAATEEEIIAGIRAADADADRVLVLGGGSNLVIADSGFAGLVLRLASSGIDVTDGHDGVLVRVQAGEGWDQLVE
jgi:UDP-N-acetylmuramate dehydrogenase